MKYKSIIFDIDGTLMAKQNTLPSRAVTAAIKNINKELHVGLATSRPLSLVIDLAKYLSLTGPSIISGGAQVVNLTSYETLWEKPIIIDEAIKIINIFNKFNVDYFIHQNNEEVSSKSKFTLKKPLYMSTAFIDPDLSEMIYYKLATISHVTAFKTNSWQEGKEIVMISHIEATKQQGILKLAKLLGITAKEIIGVGDGYNDFPFLKACGLKIAMGNAVPELKAIADYIAPSIEKDGVAHIIDKFIL